MCLWESKYVEWWAPIAIYAPFLIILGAIFLAKFLIHWITIKFKIYYFHHSDTSPFPLTLINWGPTSYFFSFKKSLFNPKTSYIYFWYPYLLVRAAFSSLSLFINYFFVTNSFLNLVALICFLFIKYSELFWHFSLFFFIYFNIFVIY